MFVVLFIPWSLTRKQSHLGISSLWGEKQELPLRTWHADSLARYCCRWSLAKACWLGVPWPVSHRSGSVVLKKLDWHILSVSPSTAAATDPPGTVSGPPAALGTQTGMSSLFYTHAEWGSERRIMRECSRWDSNQGLTLWTSLLQSLCVGSMLILKRRPCAPAVGGSQPDSFRCEADSNAPLGLAPCPARWQRGRYHIWLNSHLENL